MYVNQIDNIIDRILDQLYTQITTEKGAFLTIVEGQKINFVEYRDSINNFISDFTESIDIAPIQELINNKQNMVRIMDIIKRYVAYYYFLSIAYYYTGTIKDFRNNLIQYSKLQETSTFYIRNFFDTENNYQIIRFFKIIKDSSKLLLMTDLQKKSINQSEFKDAVEFLNSLGREYIDSYLLQVVNVNNEETVSINVHNLIKTIVFGEIYRNQEQHVVFEILNDIEENETEFTYIDIVVNRDELSDYENIRQIFVGEENGDVLSRELYELTLENEKITYEATPEKNNSDLIKFDMVVPIVDDFLRYHRDSERLEVDNEKGVFLPLVNNTSKNIQLALLFQQRKKKENTKAQLIVSKIDAISDLYSNNVKSNTDLEKEITKYFSNPFSYRKTVLHNYLEEVRVIHKIINQGKRAIEGNEYFLELREIINNAYFNFRDFKNYGTSVLIDSDKVINMLRYSNIENLSTMTNLEVETRSASGETLINMVGLTIQPLNNDPILCTRKNNLIDIRNIEFNYMKHGKKKTIKTDNGFIIYLKLIKHIYIQTLSIDFSSSSKMFNDLSKIRELNPNLLDKLIYWIYDIDKDSYDVGVYENVNLSFFQERIKVMNSTIYEKILDLLDKRIIQLINENINLDTYSIQSLVEIFSKMNYLDLSEDEKREIIIKNYLQTKPLQPTSIIEISEENRIPMPIFVSRSVRTAFKIKIDMVDPTHLTKYVELEVYSKPSDTTIKKENKCQHENEWNKMIALRTGNINRYNVEVTQFIEKFVISASNSDFVCKICGQVLPIKEYVQDGSFDNNTQRFITAYVPVDIPLEDITEYRKYGLIIKYLDALVNRFSLITGTNMLTGATTANRQKRKAMVKNIIDIMVKHNSVNLTKNINIEDRLEYFSKKFNIDKDLDAVYFFEVDDSIINFSDTIASNVEISKLKYNNMILYFILIFISELNGAQISMMSSDKKIGNIYTFLNYGPKLFDGLLIKKNINDKDTVPITNYPVLCYLIFIISYYLIQYKLWNYSSNNSKTFNPIFMKMIINSLVDMFNSIMIDAGRLPDDYVYLLTSNKLYSQLNEVFNNNDIINLLKKNHARYASKTSPEVISNPYSVVKSYSIENPIEIGPEPRSLHTFKIGDGIFYGLLDEIIYPKMEEITDLTNCPQGSYHHWKIDGSEIVCSICGEKGVDVNGDIDRLNEAYYYNLNKLARRRCKRGTLHDLVGKNGEFVCSVCGESPNKQCSIEELDQLSDNLNRIEDERIERIFQMISQEREKYERIENQHSKMISDLMDSYRTETGEKVYGKVSLLTNNLIKLFESVFGPNSTFNIDTFPVYLDNNIYIIDHTFNGSLLTEPIVVNQQENIIHFKENHSYFKVDVYYYTDNRSQVDVFYDAVTLKLLGYKERHKEYVRVNTPNIYLKISSSIRERILTIGFESRYLDINTNESNNLYFVLDSLIKEHVSKTKTIIDKFIAIFNKIVYYVPSSKETDEEEIILLATTRVIDALISKYYPMISNLGLNNSKIFNEWNVFRNAFYFQPVNWAETNILLTDSKYVNVEIINYYDVSSNIMIYYFINELIFLLNDIPNSVDKINVSQMSIEILSYLYELYNTDKFRNILEYKRFGYLLNGSDMMVDVMRKGQGLQVSQELEANLDDTRPDLTDVNRTEEEQEELEDLKEEAEALDIESDYFMEEDEDYAEQGDADF